MYFDERERKLSSKHCEALRDEYKIYHQLRSKGVTAGITTPLGLFDDVEVGACILAHCIALLYCSYLQVWDREAVLATLAEIHHADILHGNLCLDNILVADSSLTIVIHECEMIKTQNIANIYSLDISSTHVKSRMDVLEEVECYEKD